jgi:hypothetical protein
MGSTDVEKISIQPELEDIALFVKSLPVLIGLTGLKANGVTADTAFWQPMRVS